MLTLMIINESETHCLCMYAAILLMEAHARLSRLRANAALILSAPLHFYPCQPFTTPMPLKDSANGGGVTSSTQLNLMAQVFAKEQEVLKNKAAGKTTVVIKRPDRVRI